MKPDPEKTEAEPRVALRPNKPGRPMRYGPFILQLEDREVYGVDSVVEAARKKGLFRQPPYNEYPYGESRRKAYDALSKFRKKYMAVAADGIVTDRHGSPALGWYGRRWKAALPDIFSSRLARESQAPPEGDERALKTRPAPETEAPRPPSVPPGGIVSILVHPFSWLYSRLKAGTDGR
ncbi:MAG: hypothetical protein QNK37_00130 [Acidobacteriota bacterium]|nr:hypothetical protein [Acidobacteriota bacterium]